MTDLAGLAVVDQGILRRLVAFDIKAHKTVTGAILAPLGLKRPPAGEVPLVEIDQAPEPQLEGRAATVAAHGLVRGQEIGIGGDEAGLDPCEIQGGRAHRADAAVCPRQHQSIPEGFSVFRCQPEFVAEIAGKPGPRNGKLEAVDLCLAPGKGL